MKKKKIRDGLKEREDGMLELVDSDAWFKSFEAERKTLKWKLTRPYWIVKRIIEDTPREIKYSIQRAIRGYSSSDIWSLDYAIARRVLPMLIAFRKADKMGVPTTMFEEPFKTEYSDEEHKKADKKWNDILDKMIYAFKYVVYDGAWGGGDEHREELGIKLEEGSDRKYEKKSWEEANKRHKEGMKLFAEHFMSLWD